MAKKRKSKGGKATSPSPKEEPSRGTRSSARKPKKRLSDDCEGDYNLRNSLESDGLTIVDMNSDGNCLFRALSDQLYGDYGNFHDETRSDICDFMEQNQDDFQVFLVLDDEDCEEDEDAKDFEGYMGNMREDGEWGGNLELVAAARLYQRKITVFSASLAAYTIEHGEGKPSGPDLLLSFHDNDHYNSVRDKKSPPNPTTQRTPKQSQHQPVSAEFYIPEEPPCSSTPESSDDATSNTTVSSYASYPSVADNSAEGSDAYALTKPLKKSAPCPCGSGLRYKRCCHAKEKHAARLEKLNGKSADDPMDEDDQEISMKGNFRVMHI